MVYHSRELLRGPPEILTVQIQSMLNYLDWFLGKGADPHLSMSQCLCCRMPLNLTLLMIMLGELPAWFRILYKHGHEPLEAAKLTFWLWCSFDFYNEPNDTWIFRLIALFFEAGAITSLGDLITIPKERATYVSGKDFDDSIARRFKEVDSGGLRLRKKHKVDYEDFWRIDQSSSNAGSKILTYLIISNHLRINNQDQNRGTRQGKYQYWRWSTSLVQHAIFLFLLGLSEKIFTSL